jgi:hypothetical protein
MLFAILTLILILQTSKTIACAMTVGSSQFIPHRHFFAQYSSSAAHLKFFGAIRNSLNIQLYLSFKLTSLASDSATNRL